jgi:protein SCO1/2
LIALALTLAVALPPLLRDVDIDEHLGAPVPLDLPFTDENDREQPLKAQLAGDRPVLLMLAYLRCEMLCDLVLRGVVDSLRKGGLTPGRDFRAVTVSIDPHDRPSHSRLRKKALLQALNQPDAEWPFLVGEKASIDRLADRLGFRYVYDPQSNQYAHPAAVFVLTPDGRIARYLYGVQFRPLDLKLALAEASRGKVGGIVDRVLLTCFKWDPASRRYGLVVSGVMKGGAALVGLAVLAGLFYLFRLERRRR